MTIPPELEAQILRYYHVEKWRTGTIAAQLGVHHGTVTRVLTQAGLPQLGAPRRASAIDPYLPFIRETLEKFPTLTASRLYAMVKGRVDWGHFGHLQIGRARRALMGFVMVLSWSRMIFLRFFLGAHRENFLRGHVGAFAAWGGVPRTLLYDNLKSAVLERQGQAIRFNPVLLGFAGRYPLYPRQLFRRPYLYRPE